jgi:large subunit ribosomal protein L24e
MECSFCGKEIENGTETLFVTKKGKVFHFCSSKCEKNLLKLGRKARRVRWTDAYREEKVMRLKTVAAKEEKIEAVTKEGIKEKAAKKVTDEAVKEKEKKKTVKAAKKKPEKKIKKAAKKKGARKKR